MFHSCLIYKKRFAFLFYAVNFCIGIYIIQGWTSTARQAGKKEEKDKEDIVKLSEK